MSFGQQLNRFELTGGLGATRYNAQDQSLDGLNAELRALWRLGPQTSVSAYVTRDLNDQTLNAVESLVQSGAQTIGTAPGTPGFFTETRVGAEYIFIAPFSTLTLNAELAELDYSLLPGSLSDSFNADGEDRRQGVASLTWQQRLNTAWRSELSIDYATQEYDNRRDNAESILATARLIYAFSPTFDVQLSASHDEVIGLRTRLNDAFRTEDPIDVTENRVSIGLRWFPPSRASQELTVQLKSLLR